MQQDVTKMNEFQTVNSDDKLRKELTAACEAYEQYLKKIA